MNEIGNINNSIMTLLDNNLKLVIFLKYNIDIGKIKKTIAVGFVRNNNPKKIPDRNEYL